MSEKRYAAHQKKMSGKDKRSVLGRLCRYLAREKWLFLLAIGLLVCSNLLALYGPKLTGYAVDAIGTVKGNVNFSLLFGYIGRLVAVYLLAAVLSYVTSVLMVRISQRIVLNMREDVFDHLLSLPVGFYDRTQAGEIISVISYDIDTVNESLSHDFVQLCTGCVTVVGSFIMMLTIAPTLVLVFAFTIPLSVLLTRFLSRKVQPLFRRRSARLGEMNGYVEENLIGLKTVHAYGAEKGLIDGFGQKNSQATDAYRRAEGIGRITGPTVGFVNNLSLTLVSVFGAFLYLADRITIGNISSFILYSRKFSGPINEIANMYGELQSAFAAAERVFRLLDEPTEGADAPDAADLDAVKGHVQMQNISFGYTEQSLVLQNFDLTVQAGQTVAIVGPTGAGKTTVINLLMRFYDPLCGNILLDGKDIRTVKRNDLRRQYTMVLQDTWLFRGTVYENIAYGKDGATQEEVEAAAKCAGIHSYISHLPLGYDTLLTDEGVNISKGQKQLLTIARAMLSDAPVLILDEATSNVDTRTEEKIQAAMRTLMKGRTCFVIAHRLSTIKHADVILVVKDGRIAERGTHTELLALGGIYAQMYASQFE